MKAQLRKEKDIAVISVAGEVNGDTVPRFREAVVSGFSQQLRDYVVEVAEITSIDSAGLQAFSDLQRQCEDQLGMVCLCGADPALRKILELTRLDQRFNVHETLDQALASFA